MPTGDRGIHVDYGKIVDIALIPSSILSIGFLIDKRDEYNMMVFCLLYFALCVSFLHPILISWSYDANSKLYKFKHIVKISNFLCYLSVFAFLIAWGIVLDIIQVCGDAAICCRNHSIQDENW